MFEKQIQKINDIFNIKLRYFINKNDRNVIWFVAADITKALGYANVSYVIRKHVADKHKCYFRSIKSLLDLRGKTTGRGGNNTILINDSGLNKLLLSSRKRNALIFRNVYSEVSKVKQTVLDDYDFTTKKIDKQRIFPYASKQATIDDRTPYERFIEQSKKADEQLKKAREEGIKADRKLKKATERLEDSREQLKKSREQFGKAQAQELRENRLNESMQDRRIRESRELRASSKWFINNLYANMLFKAICNGDKRKIDCEIKRSLGLMRQPPSFRLIKEEVEEHQQGRGL